MNNSTIDTDQSYESYAAGAIIMVLGLIGVSINLTTVFLVFKVSSLRNSFGYLNACHMSADCGILFVFLVWAGPNTLLNSHDAARGLLGRKIGQMAMLFWYIGIYTHVTIALNRLVATLWPSAYRRVFTIQGTIKIIFGIIFFSFLHIIVYFADGCDFIYNPIEFYWEYSSTPCGNVISYYLDFVHGITSCIFVLAIDVFTIIFLRRSANILLLSNNNREMKKRHKRDVRFFLQALTTAVVFTLMIACFHIISKIATTRWQGFMMITFVWELAHALDGLIIICFNQELRHKLLGKKKSAVMCVSVGSTPRDNRTSLH